ncbi:LamG domain-containing protein [Flavobacterium ajazii]|uniref:LamG domain-containing protein n=1 Tax=Flavobacterium ajazii TaxID=2692318 RepID=UPI0013D09C1B|nr:LamG domain-containing protein [Flavobacterium ajazii]
MKKLLLTLTVAISLEVCAQTPIHEFNFNGNLHNTDNTISFMGTENYVADRTGKEKSAQRLTNKALEAVIDNLPQKDNARTIVAWIKMNDISLANYIWGYGEASSTQYFGLLQQGTTTPNSDLSLAAWGTSNDIIVNVPLEKEIWYQYSITFDGNVSKIYRNGELLKSEKVSSLNTEGNIFRLGEIHTKIGINADFDDLKIYNIALSEKEIRTLYNAEKQILPFVAAANVKTETVTNKDAVQNNTNTVAIVKPNSLDVKKIEIFSQGKKVMGNETKEIKLNELQEGIYLLKITSPPSKKTTSK